MRSASPQTSSAESSTAAPARSNSASRMELPSPAPRSTSTRCSASLSARTPAGVIATRYSWSFSSRGMPTSMVRAPSCGGTRTERCHAPPPVCPALVGLESRSSSGAATHLPGRVGLPAPGTHEAVEAERDQRLGVARRAARGQLDGLVVVERDHLDPGLLPVARRRLALERPHALRQVEVDHLVAPAWRGVEGREPGEAAALDPQLLGQLAPQGVGDRLADHVVLAGDHLDHAPASGVPPLVDQEDAAFQVDHQRGDSAGMLHHLALAHAPVQAGDAVDPDLDQLAGEGPLGAADAERPGPGRVPHRGSASPARDLPRPASTDPVSPSDRSTSTGSPAPSPWPAAVPLRRPATS